MSSSPPLSLGGNNAIALQYRFPSEIRVDAAGVGSLAWRTGQGPFNQTTIASQNSHVSAVQWRPDMFTPEECAGILAAGRANPRIATDMALTVDAYRLAHVTWLEPQPDNHWLYHRLGALFNEMNRLYGFDMVGMVDALQFLEYGPGDDFAWHMDMGSEQTSLRKLSVAIQLSAPDDYDGGDTEFVGLPLMPAARQRGSLTVFPSFMGHRIHPVTRGTRCILAGWAAGQPFR